MVIPDWSAPKAQSTRAPKLEFRPDHSRTPLSLARPLDRLAAAIVDVFVLLVPFYVLLSAPFKRLLTTSFILGAEPELATLIACMAILGVALVVTYQTFLHYFFGATFGKMLFDLRVQPLFGEGQLSFTGCLFRAGLWVGEILCLLVPMLSVFSNSKRRVLHDRICDTVVVSKSGIGGVSAPGSLESGLVRGLFYACGLLALLVCSFQIRGVYDRLNVERGLAGLVEREGGSGECEAVAKNFDHETKDHARLELAMTLYAAGLGERACLESELEREFAMGIPVGPMNYLAQAFVNSADAEVSNAYLDQVCEEAPSSNECAMSQVVGKWSSEDWGGVEQLLLKAKSGSGFLDVWAVRHFMKQARYGKAMEFLNGLIDRHELAEFSLEQRVRALYNSYLDSEAGAALAQALTILPKDEGDDLSSWVCAQQLQSGCGALNGLACRAIRQDHEMSEIDFERPSAALAKVMALECKDEQTLDYLTFSESVKDPDWQIFFRANLKHQKNDDHAAYTLFTEVIESHGAPEQLRVEAVRRAAGLADREQLASLFDTWQGLESKEVWAKSGNLLFNRFVQKQDAGWATRMARILTKSESLSPQSLTALGAIEKPMLRRPASAK